MSDRYRLTPPKIEISAEEIRADLIYPARAEARVAADHDRKRVDHTRNGSVRSSR